MKTAIALLLFLWQFPQNLLGLLFYLVLEPTGREISYRGKCLVTFRTSSPWHGFSLGSFIFIPDTAKGLDLATEADHGYGHTIQSKILGPLYLILICLPAIVGNTLDRFNFQYKKHYYDQIWERGADILGGVHRDRHE